MKVNVLDELRLLESIQEMEGKHEIESWPTFLMTFGKGEGFFFDPKAEEVAIGLLKFQERDGIKYFNEIEVKEVFKSVLIG